MDFRSEWGREGALALKFAGVGLLGFCTDALILHIGLALGLQPEWGRVISLFCAMQVTFTINGLHVFRCFGQGDLVGQWLRYMTTNGFGNFCNYWIFVTLISLHWSVVSTPMFALAVGSVMAWGINYLGTRFIAFAAPDSWIGKRLAHGGKATPVDPETGSILK